MFFKERGFHNAPLTTPDTRRVTNKEWHEKCWTPKKPYSGFKKPTIIIRQNYTK